MRGAAALLLAGLLGACASPEGLAPRSTPTEPKALEAGRTLNAVQLSPAGWPAADWWKRFGDPQLDALVTEALAANPNSRIARAHLDKARALAQSAGAGLAPRVNGTGQVNRTRYSENGIFPPPIGGATFTQYDLNLDFAYDLDLAGRNRALLEAALGQVRASEIDGFAARLNASAAVAQAYVQLGRVLDQLDLARQTLAEREQVAKLTRQRVAAGLDTKVELHQVEASLPEARQRIEALENEEALVRHQLGALLGQGPDRGLAIQRPQLTAWTVELPSTLPADLLGRRPDVVAQRWRVEAARRDIAAAKAAFYPDVNLMALAGFQSVSLSNLLSAGSAVPSLGAAVRLPIFDGDRLRGELAARDADYDLAVEQYNATLLDALREVVDQIATARSLASQRGQVEAAVQSFEQAYDLVVQRYRGGLGNYLQVLNVEEQLVQQRALRADLHARELEQSIALARALGGGYHDGD